jgi:hypothetical protein
MTVVATWYRKKFDQVWCVADTRLSNGSAVVTDSGPKLLPIPISRYVQKGKSWALHERFDLGFAYSGSTLSAISTHALASASMQNLKLDKANAPRPPIENFAELFRRMGENYAAI